MSGASLPTQQITEVRVSGGVLIPDEWGKSSDEVKLTYPLFAKCLNPR